MTAIFQSGFVAFAITLAVAVAVPAGAGPNEDGLAAYGSADYAAAPKFWRPFAEQGDAEAQHKLGVMYADGAGVPRDYAAAYMWFTLAAGQGFEAARKARDIVVKRMTHGQIEEARLIAREWRAEHQR